MIVREEKPKYSENNLPQRHFINHKSHKKWPGIERPKSSQLGQGTAHFLCIMKCCWETTETYGHHTPFTGVMRHKLSDISEIHYACHATISRHLQLINTWVVGEPTVKSVPALIPSTRLHGTFTDNSAFLIFFFNLCSICYLLYNDTEPHTALIVMRYRKFYGMTHDSRWYGMVWYISKTWYDIIYNVIWYMIYDTDIW